MEIVDRIDDSPSEPGSGSGPDDDVAAALGCEQPPGAEQCGKEKNADDDDDRDDDDDVAEEPSDNVDLNSSPSTSATASAAAFVYRDAEHAALSSAALWHMRATGELVDVTLRVDGGAEFPCHRAVLAARSAYFRAMFTSGLAECRQQRVDVHGVSTAAMRSLVRYMYTGSLRLTAPGASRLLAAAALLQLDAAKAACEAYMERHLDESNCVQAYAFAGMHACPHLRRRARELMERHYAAVCRSDEFASLLACDSLTDLVASNDLNVDDEAAVLESVLRWLRHDLPARRGQADAVLRHVRFKLLDADTLERLESEEELLRSAKAGLSLVRKARKFLTQHDKAREERLQLFRMGMIKPAHCLLLVGGVDRSLRKAPAINCYNPLTREAYCISSFVNAGDRSGYYDVEDVAVIVTSDNRLFVAGGNYIFHETKVESDDDSLDDNDEEEVRRDVYEYDADHDCWTPVAPMLFPRSNFSMTEIDGKLYGFGGVTANQLPTEIVECYNLADNRWSYVGMMPTTLVDMAAVVVGGKAYILGGRTGMAVHNSVLRFEPTSNGGQWHPLAGMPSPRFNFGAAVVQDDIYVAGGQVYLHGPRTITRQALSTVEIYNVPTNQWRQGCHLPQPLYNAGLFLVHGDLYCCGTTEVQRSAYSLCRHNVVYRLSLSLTGSTAAAAASAAASSASGGWTRIEGDLCNIRNFACAAYHLHTRKLSQIFRPDVDT